ncbi:lycopene elongase [Haloglomus irregulare]|jgi:4-hydroxybenzoate polyprenyltransferase|uniref:Lycopene elongase n=1 Tax=Haloglomus irregulare TaxID=2234134 RepID=A0A554NCL7_9EURY|nr:prenyltransferase [Haloglomus irregulare]TSD15139.1 lycopene elongase [Haloglomus irregulare]
MAGSESEPGRFALDRVLPPEDTAVGYLLRLSRPRFWLYLAGPVIVGVAYAADSVSGLFDPLGLALFGYFLLPANVYLYGVNDIFDADIDAENPKKEGREVRYQGSRLVVGAVIVSGLLGLAFVPLLPLTAVAVLVLFGLLATEYSAPPLRFKTTPFLDSVSNGLYILPGVIAYTALAGRLPPLGAIIGGWLWTMGMHTFSAIPDIEPDRRAGIRTTATYLGEFNTYLYCGLMWLVAAMAFVYVHPFFTVVLMLYPLLVFGITYARVDVDEAYWWYPIINTLAGMVITMGGLYVLVYGNPVGF